MDDKSGIYSLGGFAYQIRVFIALIPMIKKGESLSFEVIDDVSACLKPEDLDECDDDIITNCGCIKAIQVKKTDVTIDVAKKILKNWIKICIDHPNVDKYVLYTDRLNVDNNIFSRISLSQLFAEVNAASSTRSLDGKLKALNLLSEEFNNIAQKVLNNIEIKIFKASDDEIKEEYEEFFMKPAVTEFTYVKRIEQFMSAISIEILDEIVQGNQYILDWEHILKLKNKEIIDITDEHMNLSYANYKRLHTVNLDDLAISHSRQYRQLCECNLNKQHIERNLYYDYYYKECKMGYFQLGKKSIVDDIEVTAYENFCDTKDSLQQSGEDTPYNRLIGTKNKPNSRTTNEQIKYGVCIDLTREETPDHIKISWKDEDDE